MLNHHHEISQKLDEFTLLEHYHHHEMPMDTRSWLFVCGKNDHYQLMCKPSSSSSEEGNNKTIISCLITPQLSEWYKIMDDVIAIANGDIHTLFLTKSGQVFGIGNNQQGQLGAENVDLISNLIRIPVKDDVKVTSIICGSFHSMLLGSNGSVYVAGDSSFHQLGIEDQEIVTEFTKVQFPEPNTHVSLIATSYSHSVCYCENGNKVFGMGSVFEDIYGDAYCTPQLLPLFQNKFNCTLKTIQAGYRYTLFLTSENEVYLHGKFERTLYAQPIKISIPNIRNIFAGGNHYFLETLDSKFYGCGLNDDKQIPFYSETVTITPVEITPPQQFSDFRITSIAAGSYHTGVVTACGRIYTCGWNELGQLGSNTKAYSVECSPLHMDLSVQLDISRGTTAVKIFMSPSADNTFLWFRRIREKLQFFIRLFQKIQGVTARFSDIAVHTIT
ncbi:hypothetical protein C9374_000646 [Naegleria lovaniensis]|uniref:Uncharacterized protein n=1 Tax=Naegleria lovaniensis TaxID=51637 RepID=A0AA88KT78_NAELO|nr:uncharacterized protein C9374_000646 [Naegleria lovaniensis]KAG2388482.1 hypothetical protein C9374_000646 [Naegleria lovaniensis]